MCCWCCGLGFKVGFQGLKLNLLFTQGPRNTFGGRTHFIMRTRPPTPSPTHLLFVVGGLGEDGKSGRAHPVRDGAHHIHEIVVEPPPKCVRTRACV
jgi:hypothetical protein